MKRFLMELFARHKWETSGEARQCIICARREVLEFEQDEFRDGYDWQCADPGDVARHWITDAPVVEADQRQPAATTSSLTA